MLLPSLRVLQLCGQSPEDGLTRSWFLGRGKARRADEHSLVAQRALGKMGP